MKRKIADEIANSNRIDEICVESNSENVASSSSSSSVNANVSGNTKCANKEEGSSKRKRGRPRKAEPTNLPSTSDRALLFLPLMVLISALSVVEPPCSELHYRLLVSWHIPYPLYRAAFMENGRGVSIEVYHQREASFLQAVLGFVKEQKKEQQEKVPILEKFSVSAPSKVKQSTKGMGDVIVIHDRSVVQTSQSEHSKVTEQSNRTEQKNAVTVNCIVSTPEGSFEDFTQMTAFRTAQIIVRGRTLFVNPYALIEYSDIVANVVEKSGRSCKIQLDFMDFDDLQTSLRIFCRSPATGLKERLNDPNNAVAQKKYQALRSCSVFINVLKEVVECDDIPEIPTELGAKENEAVAEWYVPSKYRKFELIPADAHAVFVNMELIKEYSPVLAESPAIFSDYCMLPQFTSAELITALNVLFRNRRTGRFHSVTLENMETLYKCAGLFDCLRPMCDSFSKGICVDAVIKGDWCRLKSMLQIQATRRKCREPNRSLLADILSSIAGLVRDTANVLERLQGAGLADIPMGIGTALMVAVTEARAGCEQSEAMRLIL